MAKERNHSSFGITGDYSAINNFDKRGAWYLKGVYSSFLPIIFCLNDIMSAYLKQVCNHRMCIYVFDIYYVIYYNFIQRCENSLSLTSRDMAWGLNFSLYTISNTSLPPLDYVSCTSDNSPNIMTSWHRKAFRITGRLWEESTGYLWVSLTNGY